MNILLQKLILRASLYGLILGFLCVFPLDSFSQVLPGKTMDTGLLISARKVDGPSLVLTSVSSPPPIAITGRTVRMADTVSNTGNKPSQAGIYVVNFYLVQGAYAEKIGSRNLDAVNAGETSTEIVDLIVPWDITPGDYNIRAQIGNDKAGGKTTIKKITVRNPYPATVRVVFSGGGGGTVSGFPGGVECRASPCDVKIPKNTPVDIQALQLSVKPDETSRFDGWGGGCMGSITPDCFLFLDFDTSVQVNLTRLRKVTVTIKGNGSVNRLTGPFKSEALPNGTTFLVAPGEAITLEAIPNVLSTFNGWSGNCSNTPLIPLTNTRINNDTVCTANFGGL